MTQRYHETGTNEIDCEHQDNNNNSIRDEQNKSALKVDKPNKDEYIWLYCDICEYRCKKDTT